MPIDPERFGANNRPVVDALIKTGEEIHNVDIPPSLETKFQEYLNALTKYEREHERYLQNPSGENYLIMFNALTELIQARGDSTEPNRSC